MDWAQTDGCSLSCKDGAIVWQLAAGCITILEMAVDDRRCPHSLVTKITACCTFWSHQCRLIMRYLCFMILHEVQGSHDEVYTDGSKMYSKQGFCYFQFILVIYLLSIFLFDCFCDFKIQDSRLFIVIHLSPGIYIQSTLWHHENYFDHAIIVRKNTLWHHDTGTSVAKHIEPTTLDRTEVNW